MEVSRHPSSSSSDRDEPLTPEANPDESTVHQDLRPQKDSTRGSKIGSSGRIRRWSEPQDGFVSLSPLFKPAHCRHISLPISIRGRTDPKYTAVYEWLDAIEKAGGAQALNIIPFRPPPDVKLPSSRSRAQVSQTPRIDTERWENAIEEEEEETPTDVVDPQAILGISTSSNTAMSRDLVHIFVSVGEVTDENRPHQKNTGH